MNQPGQFALRPQMDLLLRRMHEDPDLPPTRIAPVLAEIEASVAPNPDSDFAGFARATRRALGAGPRVDAAELHRSWGRALRISEVQALVSRAANPGWMGERFGVVEPGLIESAADALFEHLLAAVLAGRVLGSSAATVVQRALSVELLSMAPRRSLVAVGTPSTDAPVPEWRSCDSAGHLRLLFSDWFADGLRFVSPDAGVGSGSRGATGELGLKLMVEALADYAAKGSGATARLGERLWRLLSGAELEGAAYLKGLNCCARLISASRAWRDRRHWALDPELLDRHLRQLRFELRQAPRARRYFAASRALLGRPSAGQVPGGGL